MDEMNEVNEQLIPTQVWDRLLHKYRMARTAQLHRGRFADLFQAYLTGVADGMEIDQVAIFNRVKKVVGL